MFVFGVDSFQSNQIPIESHLGSDRVSDGPSVSELDASPSLLPDLSPGLFGISGSERRGKQVEINAKPALFG